MSEDAHEEPEPSDGDPVGDGGTERADEPVEDVALDPRSEERRVGKD